MVKMGRPTDEVKSLRVVVRITETQNKILSDYCNKNNCNKMQAIRKGIEKLSEDVKK